MSRNIRQKMELQCRRRCQSYKGEKLEAIIEVHAKVADGLAKKNKNSLNTALMRFCKWEDGRHNVTEEKPEKQSQLILRIDTLKEYMTECTISRLGTISDNHRLVATITRQNTDQGEANDQVLRST